AWQPGTPALLRRRWLFGYDGNGALGRDAAAKQIDALLQLGHGGLLHRWPPADSTQLIMYRAVLLARDSSIQTDKTIEQTPLLPQRAMQCFWRLGTLGGVLSDAPLLGRAPGLPGLALHEQGPNLMRFEQPWQTQKVELLVAL